MTARTRTVLLVTALILGALLNSFTPPRCNHFCGSVSVWVAALPPRFGWPSLATLAPLSPLLAGLCAHTLCNRLWYGVCGFAVVASGKPLHGGLRPASAGLFHAGPPRSAQPTARLGVGVVGLPDQRLRPFSLTRSRVGVRLASPVMDPPTQPRWPGGAFVWRPLPLRWLPADARRMAIAVGGR